MVKFIIIHCASTCKWIEKWLFSFDIFMSSQNYKNYKRNRKGEILPGSTGLFLPQNSTVSFRKELGKQWYTSFCFLGSLDNRSWPQLSLSDASIHSLMFFRSGQESTLCTHFGRTANLPGVIMKMIA